MTTTDTPMRWHWPQPPTSAAEQQVSKSRTPIFRFRNQGASASASGVKVAAGSGGSALNTSNRGSTSSSPNSIAAIFTVASLSRGLLPEPHLGEWMHDGQPSSQGQAVVSDRQRRTRSSRISYARTDRPTPPG